MASAAPVRTFSTRAPGCVSTSSAATIEVAPVES
jgi:hypothetical protein